MPKLYKSDQLEKLDKLEKSDKLDKSDKPDILDKYLSWLTRNFRTSWSGVWAFVDIAVCVIMRSSNIGVVFGQSNTDSKKAIGWSWSPFNWWSGINVVCPAKMDVKEQKENCCLQHFIVKTVEIVLGG